MLCLEEKSKGLHTYLVSHYRVISQSLVTLQTLTTQLKCPYVNIFCANLLLYTYRSLLFFFF